MKKTLLPLMLVGALASNIFADEGKVGGIQLGADSSSAQNNTKDYSGAYIGLDGFLQIQDYLFLGIGLDSVFLGSTTYQYKTSYSYIMGTQLKLAYSLEKLLNWKANIKAGLGYGVTRFNDTNGWGIQYEVGVETQIYKSFGIGYKYKVSDTDFAYLGDMKSHIGYVKLAF